MTPHVSDRELVARALVEHCTTRDGEFVVAKISSVVDAVFSALGLSDGTRGWQPIEVAGLRRERDKARQQLTACDGWTINAMGRRAEAAEVRAEAAEAELSRMREEARKIIEPFASAATEAESRLLPDVSDDFPIGGYSHITLGNYRAARTFLATLNPAPEDRKDVKP